MSTSRYLIYGKESGERIASLLLNLSAATIGLDEIKTIMENLKKRGVQDVGIEVVDGKVKEPISPLDPHKDIGKCDACDGEGSLMYQWGKKAMLECGGSRKPFSDGRPGFYYADAQGQEIGLKTIGGPCSVCQGTGKTKEPIDPQVKS